MTFMEWQDSYSVGVAIFDDEHKKLIAIINRLSDAIDEGVGPTDLDRICDHLAEYAAMHFRHEEMYFEDWSYPEAEPHIARHKAFRQKIDAYRKAITDRDSGDLADEMLVFLREWLTYHILVDDRAYGQFLHNKGFG